MRSIDADNLDKIVHEAKGILRDDIIQAMEGAITEIDRLQAVVIRYQKQIRELKKAQR